MTEEKRGGKGQLNILLMCEEFMSVKRKKRGERKKKMLEGEDRSQG